MPPALQRLAVADSGRAAPHLRVHGWSPEDPLRAGEDRGREQIIPEPDGGPRHRVCGRRGYEDEIGPAGERDVFDAARTLPPGHVRVDAGADCDGESLFRNKAEGSFCGDGPDLVPGLSDASDHTRGVSTRTFFGKMQTMSYYTLILVRPCRTLYRERRHWWAASVSVWGLSG